MVFDLKWDKMTGLLDKAKARLVAKGFSQIPGVDFTETYASTPKLSTMRLFLTHVISAGMSTAEWDVTAAYLHCSKISACDVLALLSRNRDQ